VNHTFNTTPIKKLQNYPLIITIKRMFCLLKTGPGIAFMFTSWSQHHFVTIEHLKQASNKVSHSASKQQWKSDTMLTLLLLYYCLFAPHRSIFYCTSHLFLVHHAFNTRST